MRRNRRRRARPLRARPSRSSLRLRRLLPHHRRLRLFRRCRGRPLCRCRATFRWGFERALPPGRVRARFCRVRASRCRAGKSLAVPFCRAPQDRIWRRRHGPRRNRRCLRPLRPHIADSPCVRPSPANPPPGPSFLHVQTWLRVYRKFRPSLPRANRRRRGRACLLPGDRCTKGRDLVSRVPARPVRAHRWGLDVRACGAGACTRPHRC
jgi:hypothetical protein